jgi:PAS domain S-box-containing protein
MELTTSNPHSSALLQVLALTSEAAVAVGADCRVVFLTPASERMLECRAADALGRDALALLPKGLPAPWSPEGTVLSGNRTDGVVYTLGTARRGDGSEFPVEMRLTEVEDAGEHLLLIALHDLTYTLQPQDEAHVDLWPSEKRYRSIVAAVQEGIVMQGADGRILAFNKSAERILGLTADQLEGRTSIDPRWGSIHPNGTAFEGDQHPAMITLRTGQPLSHIPMGIRRSDGSVVWISINSEPLLAPGSDKPYAVVTSFWDVTAGLAAEQALRDQEQRLRTVVENVPVGVWIMDETGKIVMGNAAGQQVWAGARYVGPEQFGEYKGWWYPSGESIAPDEWAAARAMSRGETSIDELIEIQCFDGTHKIIRNSAIPFFDSDGGVSGGIIVNQDVTEQIAAYQLAEQQVAERTREIEALLELSREMGSTLELAPLLNTVLAELKGVVDYSGAAIGIVEGDDLLIAEYVGPIPRDEIVGQRYRIDGDHPYGEVVRMGKPVILGDMWAHTPWLDDSRDRVDDGLMQHFRNTHSWLGVPLMVKGTVFGVLRIDHPRKNFFSGEHARLVSAFAAHAAVAIENARLYEQAQRTAALEERQRLARELHDSVSQALYGIALGARTAQRLLERNAEDAKKPLQYVLSLAEAAFAEMRALIFELRPDSLDTEGLIAALERQIESLRYRHQLIVEADLCEEPETGISVKEAMYRIAQEAAQNAVKHARATRIDICLCVTVHNELLLEVVDDGRGFDVSNSPPGHFGLRSMRERAEGLNGALELESAPGEGTRITVRIPLIPPNQPTRM